MDCRERQINMNLRLGTIVYYAGYFFETRILGRHKPIVGGINITSYCNLACKHCPYVGSDVPREHLTLQQLDDMMAGFRKQGIRVLFLQGGEPTLWRAGDMDFNALVRHAKTDFGFDSVACVTNAINPIDVPCDLVWVSVDGSPAVHDRVRGAGAYERMAANVAASTHPNMYANVTLSKLNVDDIESCVENIIARMPKFKAISFNFQIPYPGVEEHSLPYERRAEAAQRIVALRKKGYPILNSPAALQLMLKLGWNRTHWMIQLAHPNGAVVEGCGARYVDPKICQNCGYGVMAEVQAIYNGNPGAILDAFKLFRIVAA
jgi:MoaA/NifB/PqqE/SkfB family radical SAM enzyme